jgi:hypothetical protein
MKIGDLVRSKWMINTATGNGMVGIIVGLRTRGLSLESPIILWNGHDLEGHVLARPTPDRWEYLEVINESR